MFYKIAFLVIFFFTSCSQIERETVIIDSKNKVVSLTNNSNYVIDSLVIRSDLDTIFSVSLNDNKKGKNQIFLNHDNLDYKIYKNKFEEAKSLDNDLELLLILRRKGSNVKVNDKIANQIIRHKDVQVIRGYKFMIDNNKIDTLLTDPHFR